MGNVPNEVSCPGRRSSARHKKVQINEDESAGSATTESDETDSVTDWKKKDEERKRLLQEKLKESEER